MPLRGPTGVAGTSYRRDWVLEPAEVLVRFRPDPAIGAYECAIKRTEFNERGAP